jgi:hypothetical protein
MFLKLSLAFFFYRLLKEKWQQRVVYVIAALCIVFGFAYFCFAVFQCGVPGKDGTFWIKKATQQCVGKSSILGFGFSHATLSAGTDIILSALPVPRVRKAKISAREKLIVYGILVLAAMYVEGPGYSRNHLTFLRGSVASCFRVQYIRVLANSDPNFWVEIQPLAIWSTVEPGLGITAASLATLRPLLRRAIQTMKSFASSRTRSTNSDPSTSGQGQRSKTINTGATTLTTDPEGRQNFLLSATNPMSQVQSLAEEKDTSFLTSAVNPTSPLSSMISDNDSPEESSEECMRNDRLNRQSIQPPSGAPQLPVPRNVRTDPYSSMSSDQFRATWWDLSSTASWARRTRRQSTEQATQGSTERIIPEPPIGEPVQQASEPTTEAGFRRWVIKRQPQQQDGWWRYGGR